MIAMKSCCQSLLVGRVGYQVAGKLFNGELIKRHVGIEGVNHPIAPDPLVAFQVILVAVGVGVPGRVHPVACLMFAKTIGMQQSVDDFFVSIMRFVGLKGTHFLDRRRQSGQIKRESTKQRSTIGRWRRLQLCGIESAKDKPIDRVGDPTFLADARQCRSDGRDE